MRRAVLSRWRRRDPVSHRPRNEVGCPSWLIDAVERMQRLRMGFYVHCGGGGEGVLLREVGTRETVSCTVPAGYAGHEGEVWFVRVLSPPHEMCPRHIVINTPYVIRDWPERAYIDYVERELARMKAGKPPRTDDLHGHLMKYGPDPITGTSISSVLTRIINIRRSF